MVTFREAPVHLPQPTWLSDLLAGCKKLWMGQCYEVVVERTDFAFHYNQPAGQGYETSAHTMQIALEKTRRVWNRPWRLSHESWTAFIYLENPPRYGSRDPLRPLATDHGLHFLKVEGIYSPVDAIRAYQEKVNAARAAS